MHPSNEPFTAPTVRSQSVGRHWPSVFAFWFCACIREMIVECRDGMKASGHCDGDAAIMMERPGHDALAIRFFSLASLSVASFARRASQPGFDLLRVILYQLLNGNKNRFQ